ncbi:MAG TPA: DUF3829 domain-containing protein [Devosiaceae bacterium]
MNNILGRIALALVLFGVVFVIKDGRVPDIINQLTGKSSAVAATGAPSVSSSDDAMSDKLQAFIGCINRVDSKLRDHFKEYDTAWPKREAMEDPGLIFGFKVQVYETNNSMSKECADNLEKAVAQPPADAVLDAAGKTYFTTLRQLIPVMNAVDAYYDQEDYRDDKMAKGRELDAQIRPLFATLFAASDTILESVAEHDRQLTEKQLAAMEKQSGKTYAWYELNLMYQARRAIDAIEAAADNDKLDVPTIQAIENDFSSAVDGGQTYATAHPNIKTGLGNQPKWFSIVRYGNTFLTAVKTLRRDLADGKADDIGHDLDQALDEYNSLVEDYNQRVSNGG